MLYIIIIQINVSLKENMLKHKKDVDLKDVCDIKKYVYLEDNRSWLKNVKSYLS